MKMCSFIASVFGTLGFVLSLLAGVVADNPTETILVKAIFCSLLCYAVGYIVGLMGQQVATEHAARLAKGVAEGDAAAELQQAELRAEEEAEAQERSVGETGPKASVVPGK